MALDRPSDQNRSDWPLVTIIISTRNRVQGLVETIDSVLNQDFQPVECIVLDYGDSDDHEIQEGYGDNIRWERCPRFGLAQTANRGIELAKGEFIGFINSDDPLPPGALRPVVDALRAEPDAVLAYPDWEVIQDHLDISPPDKTPDYSFADIVRWHQELPGPGLLYRREAVTRAAGWDLTFSHLADYDFFLRVLLLGSFCRVPLLREAWRQYVRSVEASRWGKDLAQEHVRVIEKLYERDDLPEAVRKVRAEAFRNAYIVAGILVNPNFNRQVTRFQILDRLPEIHHDLQRRELPPSRAHHSIIEWLHYEISERDRTLAVLQSAAAEQEKGLAWLRETLAQQQKGADWLNEQLAERDTGIQWLRHVAEENDQTITEQRKGIEWLREQVANRDREISRLQSVVAGHDETLTETRLSIAREATEIAHLHTVLFESDQTAARLRGEAHSSESTAPAAERTTDP